MAGKRSRIPKYGTVEIKGHAYYRTTITDSEGKQRALYAKTREELYDKETKSWTRCHRWTMTGSAGNRLRWQTIAKSGW